MGYAASCSLKAGSDTQGCHQPGSERHPRIGRSSQRLLDRLTSLPARQPRTKPYAEIPSPPRRVGPCILRAWRFVAILYRNQLFSV